MARILIQVDGATIFDNNIEGWNPPPTPPVTPGTMKAADMPPSIRTILAKAMCAAIEQATGFKFKQV